MYNRSPSEGTFDSFVEFSSEGKAIQCSASFVTMAGLPSPAEIEGKTFHEIFSNLMDDEVLSDMAIVEEKVSSGKLVIPKRVGIKFYESDEVCDYILKAVPCNNDGVLLYKIYFFKMTPSLHAAYESQSAEMVYLTPLACAVIDEIGDIIDCNYSMLKMFDVSSKEEFIRDYQQFIAGINSFESYKECVVTAAEKGRVRARRLLRSKDGSDVCVEMIIRKIPTTKTFALYLYDLRKLEKVERFAENAENLVRHYKTEIKDVKKESVSKSRFLESISREIRTPMNAIIGMSDIMRTDNLDETQREFFTDIKKMSNALMQIINDILDFSHLEKGTLSLTMNDFNFYELYDNVCSMHKFVAMSKGLTFRSYVNEEIPVALFGDSVRIRQIISNLLNNAISFTNAGYIELNVDQETVGNQLFLCVNVRDTGVGIKEEEFDKVFILLESLDDRLGVGLELAITKTLIDLMGGEITFSSEYGAGSIFQVRIPVQLGDEKKVGTLSNISIVRATDDVEVLVVDDNAINLKVALAHLSTHNIHADVALNGAEAVEMALCKKYDMIFMDHMMPIMDGLEATKRIRAYGNQHTADYLSTVPILALSANTGMGMKAMFLKSGMNDFIPKPIEATELNQVLTLWLPDNKKHQLNIESKLSVSAKTTIDSSYQSVINRKIGIKNSAGDEKLYEQLTSNFKKDHADDMKKISEHINNSDLIAARYYAHTLKSAASLIGASPLARTAEIAEKAIVNKNLTLQQLHALESEFAKVFNELAILEMPRELIEVATHAFNREKALDLVEIMIPLLASGNANVLDYAPEAMSAFAFFGEPCLLFADALNDFEFEEALRILNVIKTKIHEG